MYTSREILPEVVRPLINVAFYELSDGCRAYIYIYKVSPYSFIILRHGTDFVRFEREGKYPLIIGYAKNKGELALVIARFLSVQ